MKIKSLLAGLLVLGGVANAAVTLQFSTTSIFATNFANGAGVGGSQMVWGIVVDASGNGFSTTSYTPGFNYTGNLSTGAVFTGTDDVLYLAPAVMTLTTNTNDGGAIGLNRITTLTSLVMTGNVSTGDSFAVIWFDKTAVGGASAGGDKFGIFQNAAFVLPADTATQSFASVFTGADSLKTMTGQLVPEPSVALLGALGAFGLIRRRR